MILATLHDIDCGNYRSATRPENFKQVQLQILEEINKGRYIASTTKPKNGKHIRGSAKRRIVQRYDLFMMPVDPLDIQLIL